jgi:NhaA family Na+:H+ antiporter
MDGRELRAAVRGALPALGLLVLAVAGSAFARARWPQLPDAIVIAAAMLVAALALLLPGFRRIAAVELLFENDVFFVAGVVAGLVWANVAPLGYEAFKNDPIDLGPVHFTLEKAVNDVLMAFFFGVAAKEVRESFLPGGPLGSWRKAAMPLVATAGGMAGPAVIYIVLAHAFARPDLVRGWAIPTATDIAFSALVARFVFGARHPAIPFLLLLAIADDAGGLAILAIAYPQGDVRPLLLGLVAAGVVVGLVLNRLRVANPWPYTCAGGALAWAGLHLGGLHPALALVPIIPTLPTDGAHGIFDTAGGDRTSTLARFEDDLAAPVSLILGLFGLVNGGVPFKVVGTATVLVLAGLVLGKPIGISIAVALGRLAGLEMPDGLRARDVVVLGATAGIGFTVALFVATVAFPGSEQAADLDAAKMGALGSVGAAVLSIALGRIVGVERRA